jgi:serine/threonine protein kinase
MYTPGFASPEHYGDREKLGPWSDIYSVGASIFACMSGMAPQAADLRMKEDKYTSVRKAWAGRYSDSLLQLVDWCLELDPYKRPQAVREIQKALIAVATEPRAKPGLLDGLKGALGRMGIGRSEEKR